jgi:hypothetical protein
MTTSNYRVACLSFTALLVAVTGCDPSAPDDHDRSAAPVAIDVDIDHTRGPDTIDQLHPCGNAELDPGELCDDGLANGPARECTHACTFNDCELDEQGWCIDGARDLAPCTWTQGGLECPDDAAAVGLMPCMWTVDGDMVCEAPTDLAH